MTPTKVFVCEIFKSTYLEKYLRTAALGINDVREDVMHLLSLRQTSLKIVAKKFNILYFYSNCSLHYLWPYCEITLKCKSVISDARKQISQFDIFFASTSVRLQFQWNRMQPFDAFLRLCVCELIFLLHSFYFLNDGLSLRLSFNTDSSQNHIKDNSRILHKKLRSLFLKISWWQQKHVPE